VAEARKLGVDIDQAPTRQAYFATQAVTQRKLDSAASLLVIFADHLGIKSNQFAMQSANSEPLVIAKAKQFIREHYAEVLSLGLVSKVVNTSRYYLCKRFREVTGVTFTEFVSRTRIEKAKNLLLNPNLRVSEIAYEIGFQSLNHFNRMFKKIEGQSPTEYRGALNASA
jgi:AraC-like DNA-binding protein